MRTFTPAFTRTVIFIFACLNVFTFVFIVALVPLYAYVCACMHACTYARGVHRNCADIDRGSGMNVDKPISIGQHNCHGWVSRIGSRFVQRLCTKRLW